MTSTDIFAAVFAANLLVGGAALAQEAAAPVAVAPLTAEAINDADLTSLLALAEPAPLADASAPAAPKPAKLPNPAMVRLQVLLDRAGASPGVIDGFDGENVHKAIAAFEVMHGLPADGVLDEGVLAVLDPGGVAVGEYAVLPEDVSAIVPLLPSDYAELATRDYLGYESVPELLAERFHMDIDLFRALNRDSDFSAGRGVFVTAYGPDLNAKVARIEADKAARQVRAYDAEDRLVAAYPATIGSEDNPSPTGTHIVEGVALDPTYTYNPKINFQQGKNTEVLTLPPGPNGPVGSVWIDLSEPTFGIHGTPEPSLIDKTASHGCVRLTNWDARELAGMVAPGVPVDFVD